MISSVSFSSISASTGDAVAPWAGSRVKGFSGRGVSGAETPVFSALGQPLRGSPSASQT
jgi:hypothetical protein